MSEMVKFTIDGVECVGEKGEYLIEAARKNGIFIPSLCHYKGYKPRGACRVCNVKVNGRQMVACATPILDGMTVVNDTDDLNEWRKSIIELLFVEGNHFCPACEKSGDCELQALAYRFKLLAPRYPFMFPKREIDASHPKIIMDHNRCIQCKRCVRAVKTADGKSLFAIKGRGHDSKIIVDPALKDDLTDELAQKAMDACPVGCIIKKEKGFSTPIGQRKYDKAPIGSDVENLQP